jgi:hypothetical protein
VTRARDDSRRKWVTIAVIVLILHALVLLYVRPSFFSIFLRNIDAPPSGPSAAASNADPDAIIAIQVDVEQDEPDVPDDAATPRPAPEHPRAPRTPAPRATGDDSALETVDIGDLVGEPRAPISGGGHHPGETILPRPVEITWPETRHLGHCIGQHVDVRILVNAQGGIDRLEPKASMLPEDCLRAATAAAARIRFTPGSVDGKPSALWTQVRIDFEKKK